QVPVAAIPASKTRAAAAIRWPIVLALSLSVFLTLLGKRDITTSHEARVAQTARQMSASGWPLNAQPMRVPVAGLIDTPSGKRLAPLPREGLMQVNPWLVPVINGEVRLQKPPLPYWWAAILYRFFAPNEMWARFPVALLGVIATLLIYDL